MMKQYKNDIQWGIFFVKYWNLGFHKQKEICD